jgi:hypothetical protein
VQAAVIGDDPSCPEPLFGYNPLSTLAWRGHPSSFTQGLAEIQTVATAPGQIFLTLRGVKIDDCFRISVSFFTASWPASPAGAECRFNPNFTYVNVNGATKIPELGFASYGGTERVLESRAGYDQVPAYNAFSTSGSSSTSLAPSSIRIVEDTIVRIKAFAGDGSVPLGDVVLDYTDPLLKGYPRFTITVSFVSPHMIAPSATVYNPTKFTTF